MLRGCGGWDWSWVREWGREGNDSSSVPAPRGLKVTNLSALGAGGGCFSVY